MNDPYLGLGKDRALHSQWANALSRCPSWVDAVEKGLSGGLRGILIQDRRPVRNPAAFHSWSSAMCVPDQSPRDTNGAALALMVCGARTTFLVPLMPAGSLSGPISTKSLYITG